MEPFQILFLISSIVIIILVIFIVRNNTRIKNDRKNFRDYLNFISKDALSKENDQLARKRYEKNIYNPIYSEYLRMIEGIFFSIREENVLNLKDIDNILDKVPYGILIINSRREVMSLNESVTSLFYLDKNEAIGKRTIAVFNNQNLEELITQVFLEGQPLKEDILFFGDEEIHLDIEIFPIRISRSIMDDGEDVEESDILIIIRNVTQEAEFSKLRSQFVANISHEMKTPLTSIRGYIETALDSDFRKKNTIRTYLEKVLKNVDRLNVLIDDVLNLSKIEFKRNILYKKKYDINEIILEIIDSLRLLAQKNDIKIDFISPEPPVDFLTDEDLFRQLVRNMLENSIFHSGKGSRIEVSLSESDKNILIIFCDNGVGIQKSDQPYIFQRFYRGKNPLTSKKIGSGLGLSIVKHIVELHNGSINLKSEPNQATRFTIVLPKKTVDL